ncbi:MAG: hypothetical protein ACRD3A_07690, partial [Terriglobales bacterium]
HAHLAQAHRSPRCLHVKSNGVPCGSPAMRRNPFCFFHDRYYNAPVEDTFPPLEDADAVQVALMQVLNRLRREALRPGTLDLRLINSLLYGLQTAAFNARRTSFDSFSARRETVTDDPLARPTEEDAEDAQSGASPAAPRQPKPALSGAEGAERKESVSSPTQALRPGLAQMPPAKAGWGSRKPR